MPVESVGLVWAGDPVVANRGHHWVLAMTNYVYMVSDMQSLGITDWLKTLSAALLGVLVGGIATYLSAIRLKEKDIESERKHLTLAFYGEIIAINYIANKLNYVEMANNLISIIQKSGEPIRRPIYLRIKRRYFSVYEENASRIGMLPPPLTHLIPTYYTLCNSTLDNAALLDDAKVFMDLDADNQLKLLSYFVAIFHEAKELGDQIRILIQKAYPEVKDVSLVAKSE